MTRRSHSSRNRSLPIKNIVLTIIILVTITIGVAIAATFLLQPERLVKQKVESIAANYYENVIYESMINSDQYSGNPADALEKYTVRGMTPITLRQILLLDEAISTDDDKYLRAQCDVNATSVRFFPDSPFSRTDYHVEYTYACNF